MRELGVKMTKTKSVFGKKQTAGFAGLIDRNQPDSGNSN